VATPRRRAASAPRPPADAHYNYAEAPRELIDRANRLADVCERHGVTLPEAAIAFPLRHPAVVSVVVGTRTAEQLASTVARYEAEVPEALWDELAELGLVQTGGPEAPEGSTSA